MSKHTSESWIAREFPKDHGHFLVVTKSGDCVAVMTEYCGTSHEREANANLIADAPDLLAACDMAKRAREEEGAGYENDPLWKTLSQAISRAVFGDEICDIARKLTMKIKIGECPDPTMEMKVAVDHALDCPEIGEYVSDIPGAEGAR